VGGKLVVHGEQARRVQAIFALYLERRSVEQVLAELQARGWTNREWKRRARHQD
jgi:hypothetical protein